MKIKSNGPVFSATSLGSADRGSDPNFNYVLQPGGVEVLLRDLGVFRIELEGDEVSTRREAAGQPERAVAPERPDLQDTAGILHLGQHLQQLSLQRRDRNRRQTSIGAGLES